MVSELWVCCLQFLGQDLCIFFTAILTHAKRIARKDVSPSLATSATNFDFSPLDLAPSLHAVQIANAVK
jgi:hypothetical protein